MEEKIRHANQLDLFNPWLEGNKSILIVWAWGIGSDTTNCLAKMWFNNITVVDFDIVENHNIASQFYKESQKWMPKVESLRDNVLDFTGVEIKIYNRPYLPEDSLDKDIIILAVDNMDVRKEIVDNSKPTYGIIDWRMKWECFILYTFNPLYEMDRYMITRFPSAEADHELCTMKSVSYNTYAIAAFITKTCKDIVQNKDTEFMRVFDLSNYLIG